MIRPIGVLFFYFATAFAFHSQAEPSAPSELVVHEWGVLTVGHVGGTPVLGAADRYLESLPEFVLRNDLAAAAASLNPSHRDLTVWKPVIHLYGDEGQKVEVTVSVASGYPIVFFPNPKLAGYSHNTGRDPITKFQAMTWNFSLTKKRPASLLPPPTDHWWNAARRIPSDFVLMDDGTSSERFLFYEGSTGELPKVTAAVYETSITITNAHTEKSAPVILIINDQGARSGAYLAPIPAGKSVALDKDSFSPWDEKTLLAHCQKQWQACGMTPEESAGIVECWRPELLDTPGFLLISRIPEPIYEKIFPIQIDPAPAKLTRACLVFDTLAGQYARSHWLPNLNKAGRAAFADLAHPDFKRRLEAEAKIIGLGEIMSPLAEKILAEESRDPQLVMSAKTLLLTLTQSPVCPPPLAPGPIWQRRLSDPDVLIPLDLGGLLVDPAR